MTRRHAAWTASVGLAVVLVVVLIVSSRPEPGPDLRHATVNPPSSQESTQTYDYSAHDGTITATAPASLTDVNVREVFWLDDAPEVADQQSCITFEGENSDLGGENIQPGIALRIAPSPYDPEGIRAIAIERNVYKGSFWLFWVHSWDSADPDYEPFVRAISFRRLLHADDPEAAPPWHLCVRLRGTDLRYKVWTGSTSEPAWDDDHGGTVELPAELDYPGRSGGYIAHLHAGQSMIFSGMTAAPIWKKPAVSTVWSPSSTTGN